MHPNTMHASAIRFSNRDSGRDTEGTSPAAASRHRVDGAVPIGTMAVATPA